MSNPEWKRGVAESRQQIEILRARWPKAFPAKNHEVRPLAVPAAEVAEATGWTPRYAKGVLSVWKGREAYCRAVQRYSIRMKLDGSVIEDAVDDEARAMAASRLEQIAAKKAMATERRAREAADRAAAASAQPGPEVPPASEPLPEPTPPAEDPAPAPPDPEQPRARKILSIGPAAKEALAKRGLGTTEVVTTIHRRVR
jgi:sRNA-binding protein